MADELRKFLGKQGPKKIIDLSTLNLEGEAEVEILSNITIQSGNKNKRKFILEEVYALKGFPSFENCIATMDEVKEWKHLKDLEY